MKLNKFTPFFLVIGLFFFFTSIIFPHSMTVHARSGIYPNDTENGASDSTSLEEQAKAMLSAAFSDAAQEDGPLPPNSEVVGVTIDGDKITVDLRLPDDFMEIQLDAFVSDGILQLVINTLRPLGMRHFQVRAENEYGELIPISDFLPPVQVKSPKISENLDPLPARVGPIPDRSAVPPLPGQGQPQGALSGKVVWLSAGHGWLWKDNQWKTQRPNVYGVVEDFSNAEALNYYLARYLWNAGADVWMVRERSMNQNEIIVDNDNGSPGYVET
ncbi:MAG: hypothetical protein KAS38_08285, partial [Anaerolineales bacterium]|nr:hypothetical protein [Anaerolineales bacterium]